MPVAVKIGATAGMATVGTVHILWLCRRRMYIALVLRFMAHQRPIPMAALNDEEGMAD
jgi:hypothetical protein